MRARSTAWHFWLWGGVADSLKARCDSRLLTCTEFQGGASDSVLRAGGGPVPGQGWLMVQTVWRFVVVQKTTEISQLQFIDKVLPYVVTQRQIPMVLRQCRKQRSYRSCNSTSWSSWTRLSSCPLRADSAGVQTCRKLCSAMPVVATTGVWRCSSRTRFRQDVKGYALLDSATMVGVSRSCSEFHFRWRRKGSLRDPNLVATSRYEASAICSGHRSQ